MIPEKEIKQLYGCLIAGGIFVGVAFMLILKIIGC